MKAQKMLLTVKEHKGEKVLYRKEYPVENLVVGENKQTFHIHLPAAKCGVRILLIFMICLFQ